MAMPLMAAKMLLSINQVFMNEARDSSYYSDMLESIVDLIHKEGGGI